MKDSKYLLSLLVAGSLIIPCHTFAANLTGLSVSISCPDIGNSGKEKVTNNGTEVSGKGSERFYLNGHKSKDSFPLFSAATPAGVPLDLVAGGYANSGTSYDATTNVVTCHFTSVSANPPFQVSYALKNVTNGVVTDSGNEEIKIKFSIGVTR